MEDWRIGMVLIAGNPSHFDTVRSGVRIIDINDQGFVVQRIHAVYLNTTPVESWILRRNQNTNWRPLPIGFQLPLL